MLSLQTFTQRGWVPVGAPYAVADTHRVQQAAVVLATATGAVWRVVGSDGRVLSLWDGRRWQSVAEAQPLPVPAPTRFWQQEPDFDSTVPVR